MIELNSASKWDFAYRAACWQVAGEHTGPGTGRVSTDAAQGNAEGFGRGLRKPWPMFPTA